jgi:tRNA uridine 5-carboxymethylaminomethyl modification enzyme
LKVKRELPLILDRTEGYTSILIDDLISKGTNEPYRMFTSRAEFRLHLRIDNADRRLTPHGRRVGLISDAAWAEFGAKQERLQAIKGLLETTRLTPQRLEKLAATRASGATGATSPGMRDGGEMAIDLSSAIGQTCAQLLKRPEVIIENFAEILLDLKPEFFRNRQNPWKPAAGLSSEVRNELKSVETEIKYEGYLSQQQRAIDRLKKSEQRPIPEWFDYRTVSGLSREMQEKLLKIRPRTIAHASMIPGVTPAAVSLVNVYIEIQAKRREQAPVL